MEPTASLVLETNNLRRGDGAAGEGAVAALARLLTHLRAQRHSLARLRELVITHDGVEPGVRADLEGTAGRSIVWVEIAPETDYYAAKNAGFAHTTAEVIAFADADCWPDPGWLEKLLAPFARPEVSAVAGRTRYRDDVLGRAVSLLDFLYVERPEKDGLRWTRNFYANNVAFRREVFAGHRYDVGEAFYRGHCQSLGLRLDRAGVSIAFVPDAVTIHRFPDDLGELVRLRLYRGRDLRLLAPRVAAHLGAPIGERTATVASWIGRQAIAHSDLRRREPHGGKRWLIGTVALGVATLDAIGAALGERTGASASETLAYHGGDEQLR